MTKEIFVVFDSKVKCYKDPIFIDSVGRMLRAFEDAVNDNNRSDLSVHPEDFSLHHIGKFDMAIGKFDMFETPVSYGLAVEYKKGATNV